MTERCCERCGKAFLVTQSHARFCTRRCKERAREQRRLERFRQEQWPDYVAWKIQRAQKREERRAQQREQLHIKQERLSQPRYCERCGSVFFSSLLIKRFCSKRCQNAASKREYRISHPEKHREKVRRQKLRYRLAHPEKCRERSREKSRQYRLAHPGAYLGNREVARVRWRRRNGRLDRKLKEQERRLRARIKRNALIRALQELGWLDGSQLTTPCPVVEPGGHI